MRFGWPRIQRRLLVTFRGSLPVLSLRAVFGRSESHRFSPLIGTDAAARYWLSGLGRQGVLCEKPGACISVPAITATFLGSYPVLLSRLKAESRPLELPVVRQVFAHREKASRRQPLGGPPEDERLDDFRREISQPHMR